METDEIQFGKLYKLRTTSSSENFYTECFISHYKDKDYFFSFMPVKKEKVIVIPIKLIIFENIGPRPLVQCLYKNTLINVESYILKRIYNRHEKRIKKNANK